MIPPPECELTARHDEIPAWEDMDDALRPVLAREMEVYAAYLEYADHHVGRVVDALADLGGIGKGGDVTLYVDGEPTGAGRVDRTHALAVSMDETMDIGEDAGAPVSEDYDARASRFTGTIKWVQLDIDAASDETSISSSSQRAADDASPCSRPPSRSKL